MSQLKLIGALAGDSSSLASTAADYKALVCIFLNGGNDGHSVLVPVDSGIYNSYAQTRGTLAIPRDKLLPITTRRYADGRNYALNSDLSEIKTLFGQDRVAFVGNVGTLARPTTLADYNSGAGLPLQLYSHLDQQIQWQSSLPDRVSFKTGWGGRLADLVNSMNTNNQISMSLSLGGLNYFQVGNTVAPYVVNANGVEPLAGFSEPGRGRARYDAVKRILESDHNNILGSSFASETKSSIEDGELLTEALKAAPILATVFPETGPGYKMKMIARLISIASNLGLKRQVFFLNLAGFDSHGSQSESHPGLLRIVSSVMHALYQATVELGIASQVTAFTASDFGRTYIPNGDGTDHAWGNLQWVMGGAVSGGDIYGKMPSFQLGGPEDTGRGRWIPSTSIDEYYATLARWFGVSDTNLPVVLPNIGRFAKPNLGFMG